MDAEQSICVHRKEPILARYFFLLPAAAWIGIAYFFCARLFMFQVWNIQHWAVSDDIYISACFARTLAQGHGLLWYPGAPPVEGISNPLWTLVLAALHLMPRFNEASLGAYVFILNGGIVVGIMAAFWSILRRAYSLFEPFKPFSISHAIVPAILLTACIAVPYWLAEGFEVGLVTTLALLALRTSMSDSFVSAYSVGALAGLAFWTRMDALLYCLPAFFLLAVRKKMKPLAIAGTILFLMACILFLARHAYYGRWLPNTYYLKLYGWPLAERLRKGLQLNWPLLIPAVSVSAALVLPRVWKFFRPLRALYAACALAVLTGITYSIQNGGDSWGLKAGYDRFTAPASVFLCLGLSMAWVQLPLRFWPSRLLLISSISVLLAPAIPHYNQFYHQAIAPKEPRYEFSWVRSGRSFENVTLPGARIAVQPAGAIIYFSHRGGVDLLGKCEPMIARMAVNIPDAPSGHNKRDDERVFKSRQPDVVRNAPPRRARRDYLHVTCHGRDFYARKGSPYVAWNILETVSGQ